MLTWTRLERPPTGFPPGRVVALVEAGRERVYALWEGPAPPALDATVAVERRGEGWVARPTSPPA